VTGFQVEGSTLGLADVEAFLDRLQRIDHHPLAEARSLFDPHRELIVTRAPGRLDVMGGIADYSGSLVLQLPLREATRVALQKDPERRLRLVSVAAEDSGRAVSFDMLLADLERKGKPIDYPAACARFGADPRRHWAAYVAGAFLVLARERGLRFAEGARLLVESDVPEGKGVSSSAALEVAVMQAVAAAFGVSLAPRELALLGQKVENHVAGAPCGIMDQMTAACGEEGKLLALLCQPAELQGQVAVPEDLALFGIDSGLRHAVSGSDYAEVRAGTFMGYRIVAEQARLRVTPLGEGRVRVEDPRWHGYLANLTPAEMRDRFLEGLPDCMGGRDFLARYSGTTDPVARVDPEADYFVRVPTLHPVKEHARVRAFADLLSAPPGSAREDLGLLMQGSHDSYTRCGLGSEGTDRLVALARVAADRGLLGAKITGGGSGGTVAVLARAGAGGAVLEVADRYGQETGRRPLVFARSSPGAVAFGHLRLRPPHEGSAHP